MTEVAYPASDEERIRFNRDVTPVVARDALATCGVDRQVRGVFRSARITRAA